MKEQHFKYAEELDEVPILPEESQGPIKILQVKNLVPIEITCEIGGQTKTIFAYIDYATQEIVLPDNEVRIGYSDIPDLKDFKEKTLEFLMWRRTSHEKEPEVPEEVYEQIRRKRQQMKPPNYNLGENNARED
jgi:hypothetical protein